MINLCRLPNLKSLSPCIHYTDEVTTTQNVENRGWFGIVYVETFDAAFI